MRFILTAAIFPIGLVFLFLAGSFLFDPVAAASGFGLSARDGTGLAMLRSDVFTFFAIGGLTMIVGAWRRNGDVLLVPAAMMGLALFGRIVSAIVDGPSEGMWIGMAVEAVTAVLLLVASRVLPHPET